MKREVVMNKLAQELKLLVDKAIKKSREPSWYPIAAVLKNL